MSNKAALSFLAAVIGGVCLYVAWDYERPTYVWDPEEKRKHDEYEAKANEYWQAKKFFEQYREETGDKRLKKYEKMMEKEYFQEAGRNPYKPKEIKPPRQTEVRAIAWLLIVGGIVAGAWFHIREDAEFEQAMRQIERGSPGNNPSQ